MDWFGRRSVEETRRFRLIWLGSGSGVGVGTGHSKVLTKCPFLNILLWVMW